MDSHNRFVLRQAYLLLTRKCNLSCTHCIRSSSPLYREMMDTSLALRILQKLKNSGREATLLVSGGEPTLHPAFGEIVRAAADDFRDVIINTNGMRLSPLLEVCKNQKISVQISIDGTEVQHDTIRGLGTFRKTIKNIEELSRLGVSVTIATTVTRQNIHTILPLDNILKEVRFSRWTVKRVVTSGRASDENDLKTSEWNAFVAAMHSSTLNVERLKVSFMFSDAGILAASFKNPTFIELGKAGANCGTGRSKLYINPDGSIYPCACMENQIIGSLATQDADTVFNTLGRLDIEPPQGVACHQCPAWKSCRGGCPGAAIRSTSSWSGGDPRCFLAEAGQRDYGEIDASR